MKPQATLLSALLLAVTICSCSKNDDHPTGSNILSRYVTTFRDSIVFYYIYERDANNRIISMHDSTKAYDFKTELIYNANGKVEKANYYQQGTIASSMEFTYNAAGRISKRKIRSGDQPVDENYNVYVYDAAGHLVTDSSYFTTDNSTFHLEMVSNYKYTGENITEAEDYVRNNGSLSFHSRIKYEYDNGINPFKDMEYEYFFNEAGSAVYTIQLISSNNALKTYAADGNGNWVLQSNSSYQYNSNNFVSKATAQNVARASQSAVTEYYYQ